MVTICRKSVYVENSKESIGNTTTKKQVKQGHKHMRSVHKIQFHFWKLTLKTVLFAIMPEKIKCWGINLKHIHNLHAEKYKILTKKSELNKWGAIPCLRTGRFNLEKMSILSKLMYSCNVMPLKIPEKYFCRYRQTYFKVYVERQKN